MQGYITWKDSSKGVGNLAVLDTPIEEMEEEFHLWPN
jgi:hypothetical protein